jgi:STE24 endopeptidase
MVCIFGVYTRPILEFLHHNCWNKEAIFQFVVFFTWLTFVWDLYLSFRQYKIYRSVERVPAELAGVLDQETFSKARAYNVDKTKFGFWTNSWGMILSTCVLVFDGMPGLWNWSGLAVRKFGYSSSNETLQTLMFVLLGSVISTIIDLPWSLYSTFVVEERHGFNKQTIGFYAKDKLKKFIVGQAILAPILSITLYIIKVGGDYFFLYVWVFCLVVTVFLMTVYPDYIAPLFDKFTPLPDGGLRKSIEELASSIDFPLKKLYVVEGSKRSSHSNAYFFGFYKNKRIVLFDTLLADYVPADSADAPADEKVERKNLGCNDEEVLAVLAHELGHWKLNHVLWNLLITEVNLFLCLSVFGMLYQNETIYSAFGFTNQRPVFIGLLLIFQYIFSPYNEILSFLMTCLSRRFEFQADAFAKHLNRATALRGALIKLNKDNLSFPIYDQLYSNWHHSHPPLLERIRALGKLE